ncbi:MAG: response regulator [Deltaproteobacteria bacterium]|nr:response regulator [Deltaproteobacteria bacterium]
MRKEDISIIVADDVNTMRIQIKELLRMFGFKKILLCANGEEVKKLMELEKIQLILSDWHMFPTDGLDLLKHIRAHPIHKETAFVMVTAESTIDKVMEAVTSGVDEYLLKPLTAMQVQSKVHGALLKKRMF